MNVTLPNGLIIENVPEGTSKEDIKAKAIAAGIASEQDFQTTEKPEPAEVSWWDEAAYEFDKTNADWQNWWTALQANTGLGEFVSQDDGSVSFESGVKRYGNDWLTASYEERKEMIKARDKEELIEKYADVIAFQDEAGPSTSASIAGSVAKTLASPTTLLPFGHTLKASVVIGGLVAAQHEASSQVVDGELDAKRLAGATAIGLGGGAVANRLEAVGKAWLSARNVKKQRIALENKTKTVNDEIMNGMADGLDAKSAVAQAKRRLALKDEDVLEVYRSGKLSIPSDEKVAKFAAARENAGPASSKAAGVIERAVVPISTRIRSISKPVFGRLRELEAKTHWRTAGYRKRVAPFVERASKLAKKGNPLYLRMERALMNGDREGAKRIAQEHFPDMVQSIDEVGKVLKELYDDLSGAGVNLGHLDDYFPRKVKDMGGLRETLGVGKMRTALDRFLDDKAGSMGYSSWTELPTDIRDTLTNQFLSGRVRPKFKPDLEQSRVIQQLDDDLQKHYYSASDSLIMYIDDAVKEAEKRRFFGGAAVVRQDGKIDLDRSVGSMVASAKRRGDLTPEQEGDLRAMLVARFEMGEQASGQVVSFMRALQTSALLAQFDSAVIQLSDIGSSAFMQGVWPTIRALGSRKGVPSPEELGVLQNVAADLESAGFAQTMVDKSLRWSGFRAVDNLGKGTLIKAAHIKNTELAEKRPDELVKKWGDVFGDETSALIDDLAKGEITDNVKLLLFNELADVQPIALSEMPETYLRSPNGRIFYALKSFGLKQLDVIKRTAIDEMRKGNYLKGAGALARYAGTMGLAGGTVAEVRNFMQTGEMRVDDIPDEAFETLMTILFVNEYSRERFLLGGKPGEFFKELLAPASLNVIDTGVSALVEAAIADEKQNPEKFNRVVKDIPVFGKAAYFWLLGGAERQLERERKEELREIRGR